MKDLKGKVVLVTGGAKHLGRAIALAMARAGADVAFTYHSSGPEARKTLAELRGHGGRTLAVRCDVTDPKSVKTAVERVVRGLGGIDVLVNNAGMFENVKFEDITVAQWDRIFATNARGPFLVAQAAAKSLRARRGRIVNLGSLGGLQPWAEHAHYCASKAAVTMLSLVMSKALAPEVSVNLVAPGFVPSTGQQTSFSRRTVAKTPMKRAGKPEDIVEAVMFFARASQFITGQIMVVDGGLRLAT